MFKVVIKNPMEKAFVKEYDAAEDFDLNEIQDIVGGYFQIASLNHNGKYLTVYCNEEGKIMGLEPNVYLMYGDRVADLLCGPVIVVGNETDDEGNAMSLTDEEAEEAIKALEELSF